MNKKQFLILAVLVVVVGGIGLKMLNERSASWHDTGQHLGEKLLAQFDLNAVSQISVRQGTNSLNLVRKGEQWSVRERNDYPASFNEISDLVRKLADLKVTQTEQVGPSQRPRLELVEPGPGTNTGTRVELKAGDKALASLLLGKKHMRGGGGGGDEGFPDGRYVLVGGNESVSLVSDPLATIEPNAASFLVKDFFKIEKVRAINFVSQVASNSWQLSRETETNDWKLAAQTPEEKLDSTKVSGVANALISPSFVDVVVGSTPEQAGLDKPTVVTMDTFDGFSYRLKIGAKSGEENYHFSVAVEAQLIPARTPATGEKPEDKTRLDKEFTDNHTRLEEKLKAEKKLEPWTFLVAKWTVDPILRDRPQLMADKKEDKAPDPTAIPGLPTIPTLPQ